MNSETVTSAKVEVSILKRKERFGTFTNTVPHKTKSIKLENAENGFCAYLYFGAEQHRLWEQFEVGICEKNCVFQKQNKNFSGMVAGTKINKGTFLLPPLSGEIFLKHKYRNQKIPDFLLEKREAGASRNVARSSCFAICLISLNFRNPDLWKLKETKISQLPVGHIQRSLMSCQH